MAHTFMVQAEILRQLVRLSALKRCKRQGEGQGGRGRTGLRTLLRVGLDATSRAGVQTPRVAPAVMGRRGEGRSCRAALGCLGNG